MAKQADRYFEVNPWKIIEEGFNPEYSEVAESVFSLGNEYMGIRGFFEEGYEGNSLVGSYFNGIYEKDPKGKSYKGVVDATEYMVNSVNWLSTEIIVAGEKLELSKIKICDFKRELDLKTGILTRSFIWLLKDGKGIEVSFERFLGMENSHMGFSKMSLRPINCSVEAYVTVKLDFSVKHKAVDACMWNTERGVSDGNYISILGMTKTTGQKVFSSALIDADNVLSEETVIDENVVGKSYVLDLKERENTYVTRIVYNTISKALPGSKEYDECAINFIKEIDNSKNLLKETDYETEKFNTISWWDKAWKQSDIEIDGDEENQQGIRFCIFQMYQTYHGAEKGTNIGAKGLTGEAYNGNAFWDTEVFCLPFYVFNDLKAAKNLIMYRYLTLPEAKERAKDLDCNGAFYPIATISGRECCNLWQHASLQLQASTAVAYGIWMYVNITGDRDFLLDYGLEILVEISRMLLSRGDYSQDGKNFGYYCVMGPDEFQMMVNHNFYTNYMAKWTFEYTISCLNDNGDGKKDERVKKLIDKLNVTEDEIKSWQRAAARMLIIKDKQTGVYEQHEGFFKLPHVDVDKIPVEDFPLYNHWSYDRIYRNDMIKQPDVLMAMLLHNSDFTEEELKANYEYYEPKCIHESSLSPSVHSILACQLKKQEESYKFFKFATRMDLDNYNRNTCEGLHTTSIVAAWMNIVYGFGGLRSDGKVPAISPQIPAEWSKYTFRFLYGDDVVVAKVDHDNLCVKTLKGHVVNLKIYGKDVAVSGKETKIKLK